MKSSNKIIGLVSTIRDRANQQILHQLRSHGVLDVVPAHGGIFVTLFQNGEITMGQLAQAIDRDKSTVTTLVNKLEGLSYLEKRKDDSDGRVTLIRLTEKGQLLEPVFKEVSAYLLEKVYAGFTDLEQGILITLLDRIKTNL